ncbi:MAG: HAD hydrolase family protein [Gemmatimonadaceae bacterium]|nr:HAD hydrolase family protein [Gemmatimonadaceae bacterium]
MGATPEGRDLAQRIRLVAFDVDGVLTDGGVYLGDVQGQRLEFKRYHIQDGLGMKLLQRAGIKVAIITGRVSESVALRAAELGVDAVVQDVHARKLPALQRIAGEHGIALADVAFVGDDLPDVGPMRVVGLPVVVANASADGLEAARFVLQRNGGDGAVREFCEALLRARGVWDVLAGGWVESRAREVPA